MKHTVTRLILSQDDYYNLLEALQLFIKSTKVTNENFDQLRNLNGHVQQQYARRESVLEEGSFEEGSKLTAKAAGAGAVAPVRKVGVKSTKSVVKKVIAKDGTEVETHPFVASAEQNWICTKCGKSRNSSYHKNAEGKLWLPKKN